MEVVKGEERKSEEKMQRVIRVSSWKHLKDLELILCQEKKCTPSDEKLTEEAKGSKNKKKLEEFEENKDKLVIDEANAIA